MRIGTLDTTDNVSDRKLGNEATSRASLLNTDDADTWRATDRVVECRIITRQRIWTTQRHENELSVRGNVQQVGCGIITYRTNKTELVNDRVVSSVDDRHVVSKSFHYPEETLSIGNNRAV